MGGRGSGGRRAGSGRKKLSDLERAIGGNAGKRSGVVLQHPSSTAVAPIAPFEPPAALTTPTALTALTAALELLKTACAPPAEIADAQARVDALTALTLEAVAVWHELAPFAFEARTLTPATAAAFCMLCRAVARERATELPDADHRGLMQRVNTWMKDFGIAPLGKPLFAPQVAPVVNPVDRFTKGRA
jgi:hypothetical protein